MSLRKCMSFSKCFNLAHISLEPVDGFSKIVQRLVAEKI